MNLNSKSFVLIGIIVTSIVLIGGGIYFSYKPSDATPKPSTEGVTTSQGQSINDGGAGQSSTVFSDLSVASDSTVASKRVSTQSHSESSQPVAEEQPTKLTAEESDDESGSNKAKDDTENIINFKEPAPTVLQTTSSSNVTNTVSGTATVDEIVSEPQNNSSNSSAVEISANITQTGNVDASTESDKPKNKSGTVIETSAQDETQIQQRTGDEVSEEPLSIDNSDKPTQEIHATIIEAGNNAVFEQTQNEIEIPVNSQSNAVRMEGSVDKEVNSSAVNTSLTIEKAEIKPGTPMQTSTPTPQSNTEASNVESVAELSDTIIESDNDSKKSSASQGIDSTIGTNVVIEQESVQSGTPASNNTVNTTIETNSQNHQQVKDTENVVQNEIDPSPPANSAIGTTSTVNIENMIQNTGNSGEIQSAKKVVIATEASSSITNIEQENRSGVETSTDTQNKKKKKKKPKPTIKDASTIANHFGASLVNEHGTIHPPPPPSATTIIQSEPVAQTVINNSDTSTSAAKLDASASGTDTETVEEITVVENNGNSTILNSTVVTAPDKNDSILIADTHVTQSPSEVLNPETTTEEEIVIEEDNKVVSASTSVSAEEYLTSADEEIVTLINAPPTEDETITITEHIAENKTISPAEKFSSIDLSNLKPIGKKELIFNWVTPENITIDAHYISQFVDHEDVVGLEIRFSSKESYSEIRIQPLGNMRAKFNVNNCDEWEINNLISNINGMSLSYEYKRQLKCVNGSEFEPFSVLLIAPSTQNGDLLKIVDKLKFEHKFLSVQDNCGLNSNSRCGVMDIELTGADNEAAKNRRVFYAYKKDNSKLEQMKLKYLENNGKLSQEEFSGMFPRLICVNSDDEKYCMCKDGDEKNMSDLLINKALGNVKIAGFKSYMDNLDKSDAEILNDQNVYFITPLEDQLTFVNTEDISSARKLINTDMSNLNASFSLQKTFKKEGCEYLATIKLVKSNDKGSSFDRLDIRIASASSLLGDSVAWLTSAKLASGYKGMYLTANESESLRSIIDIVGNIETKGLEDEFEKQFAAYKIRAARWYFVPPFTPLNISIAGKHEDINKLAQAIANASGLAIPESGNA